MENTNTITIEAPENVNTIFYSWDKKHLKGKPSYMRVFQHVMLEASKDKELNATDLRVLMAVLGSMEFENIFSTSISNLSESIGIDRANVSRAVSKLEQRGFIKAKSTDGRKKIYMVNPHIAFKTKSKALQDLEEDWGYLTSEHHQLIA